MADGVRWLLSRFQEAGDTPAVICEDEQVSYGYLYKAIYQCSECLYYNQIPSGSVIALRLGATWESIAWMLALARDCQIIVPMTTMIDAERIRQRRIAGVTYEIVAQEGVRQGVRKYARNHKADPLIETLRRSVRAGLILFSSGTTGTPKAIVHDLDTLLESYSDRKPKRITLLAFLPLDHIGGLHTLFSALAMTATIVLPSRRDPDTIGALIACHRVRLLPTTPTFLQLLLLDGAIQRHDFSSLRIVTYGTERMPETLLDRLHKALPRVRFMQTFGTSETGIAPTRATTSLRIDSPAYERRVVDGELQLRSTTQMLGYLNETPSITDDGWIKTGDVVDASPDGSLRIVGRKTEIINVGGLKVLPGEVEAVICQMPGVAACTVYGEPNPITGQIVVADVLLKDRSPIGIQSAIRRFLTPRMEAYKIPMKVHVVERIAHTERFKRLRSNP